MEISGKMFDSEEGKLKNVSCLCFLIRNMMRYSFFQLVFKERIFIK